MLSSLLLHSQKQDSSVSVVTCLGVRQPTNHCWITRTDSRSQSITKLQTVSGVHPDSCSMGNGSAIHPLLHVLPWWAKRLHLFCFRKNCMKQTTRQKIYVQSNIEARSRNHCCRGKTKVLHILSVSVALVTQYTTRMRRIVICGL